MISHIRIIASNRFRNFRGKDSVIGKAKFYYYQQSKEYVEFQIAFIESQLKQTVI